MNIFKYIVVLLSLFYCYIAVSQDVGLVLGTNSQNINSSDEIFYPRYHIGLQYYHHFWKKSSLGVDVGYLSVGERTKMYFTYYYLDTKIIRTYFYTDLLYSHKIYKNLEGEFGLGILFRHKYIFKGNSIWSENPYDIEPGESPEVKYIFTHTGSLARLSFGLNYKQKIYKNWSCNFSTGISYFFNKEEKKYIYKLATAFVYSIK